MSDYYNNKGRSKRRTRREKIGFYTAFSICLIAVCMAVYSTYNTISTTKEREAAITGTVSDVQVNQDVTGVTETIPAPTLDAVYTIAATQPQTVEPTTEPQEKDALETMLSANVTLTYPLNSNNVLRAFSKESVYFKSLNVWKPHLGVDFAGELGDLEIPRPVSESFSHAVPSPSAIRRISSTASRRSSRRRKSLPRRCTFLRRRGLSRRLSPF